MLYALDLLELVIDHFIMTGAICLKCINTLKMVQDRRDEILDQLFKINYLCHLFHLVSAYYGK